MVLPAGFSIPPLPYIIILLSAGGIVGYLLKEQHPTIRDHTIVGLSTWMIFGSSSYVCYQIKIIPPAIAPFFSSPAVYLTTFIITGTIWILASNFEYTVWTTLGIWGGIFALVPTAFAIWSAIQASTFQPVIPGMTLLASVIGVTGIWAGMKSVLPSITDQTGYTGMVTIFGHTLDGASTAVGLQYMGFAEQTPLSRILIDFGNQLPGFATLGGVWLFVIVKIVLAIAIVYLLADTIEHDPVEGYLLLGLVAAVGLGPGAHNILLFSVIQPAM